MLRDGGHFWKQRSGRTGCDSGFVVLAPFELTRKSVLGKLSFKGLSTIFAQENKAYLHLFRCILVVFEDHQCL